MSEIYTPDDISIFQQHELSSIEDPNFDIVSVFDNSNEYYRIASREKLTKKYLTYDNNWPDSETGVDDPPGHGNMDPFRFSNILSGTKAKNQYIRFYSTTSPFNVYV